MTLRLRRTTGIDPAAWFADPSATPGTAYYRFRAVVGDDVEREVATVGPPVPEPAGGVNDGDAAGDPRFHQVVLDRRFQQFPHWLTNGSSQLVAPPVKRSGIAG